MAPVIGVVHLVGPAHEAEIGVEVHRLVRLLGQVGEPLALEHLNRNVEDGCQPPVAPRAGFHLATHAGRAVPLCGQRQQLGAAPREGQRNKVAAGVVRSRLTAGLVAEPPRHFLVQLRQPDLLRGLVEC